ncbi:MAG: ABC transporter permease [Bacteroidales bacterium]
MDISILGFIFGLLLLLIPCYYLWFYRTGLVKDTLTAATRMIIQLFLIAIYLEYLFKWNNIWLNLLWVVIMTVVAVMTVLKRTKLSRKLLLLPAFAAFLFSVLFIVGYFLGIVVQHDSISEARYFVPVSGMVLGNMLSANVIALNAFYSGIRRESNYYRYLLGNGATQQEALRPFMRDALIKSFNPTIASMAVMGLVALPGTMTGQILGGSSPTVAIKYQIMIMISIFASSLISVLITLWLTRRKTFQANGLLNDAI